MGFRKTRTDTKRIAPCMKYSMWHCYRYRNLSDECLGCDLVRLRGKTKKVFKVNGVDMARCTVCGNMVRVDECQTIRRLTYNRFGQPVYVYGKIYRCKKCTREVVRKSQKKRKQIENLKNKENDCCIDTCGDNTGSLGSGCVHAD